MTDKDRVIAMARDGVKPAEIAVRLGLNYNTVRDWTTKAGFHMSNEAGNGWCNHLSREWLSMGLLRKI